MKSSPCNKCKNFEMGKVCAKLKKGECTAIIDIQNAVVGQMSMEYAREGSFSLMSNKNRMVYRSAVCNNPFARY